MHEFRNRIAMLKDDIEYYNYVKNKFAWDVDRINATKKRLDRQWDYIKSHWYLDKSVKAEISYY